MSEPSTREKLLNAALDLFSQKGYSASSVDEIAESIGIKGPNIYKYFKGKEGLYNDLLDRTDAEYKRMMGYDGGATVTINSAEELKQFSMGQIRFTISNDTVKKLRKMCAIEQFRTERSAAFATFHQYTYITRMYTLIFADMMERGLMKKDDPELVAIEYTAPTTQLIQLSDREPARTEEALVSIEKLIDRFIEKNLL